MAMKFCQDRLRPPLIGQLIAEASIKGTEEYNHDVYDEYAERRKCLIDGINRISGCYTPIPMGAFYTVAKLSVDDVEKFCAWCLENFSYKAQNAPKRKYRKNYYDGSSCGFLCKYKTWQRPSTSCLCAL